MYTLFKVDTQWDRDKSPCIGFTPDTLSETQTPSVAKSSQTGVSTRNVQSGIKPLVVKKKTTATPHRFALRTICRREQNAYQYLVEKRVFAFYSTLTAVKLIDDKRKTVESSHIPNIFFAYGAEEEIKSFVYDSVNLSTFCFYYRHFHIDNKILKEPLIVPDEQIGNLRIICVADAEGIIAPNDIQKFRAKQMVRIVEGKFSGIVGCVARYHGQQRVAGIINGFLTIATAYVPRTFLEIIMNESIKLYSEKKLMDFGYK